MARKARTIESRISAIEAEKAKLLTKIDTLKAKTEEFDSQIQELRNAETQKEIESLYKLLKASGKSPREFIEEINKQK